MILDLLAEKPTAGTFGWEHFDLGDRVRVVRGYERGYWSEQFQAGWADNMSRLVGTPLVFTVIEKSREGVRLNTTDVPEAVDLLEDSDHDYWFPAEALEHA